MENRYLTVSALNKYIKSKIDCDPQLQSILIKGEISNLKNHRSGHKYFTLKDEASRISSVMFANRVASLDFELKDGMKVLIQGYVSVYDVAGNYQLCVKSLQQDGLGQLHIEFDKLKKKLADEGIFDELHKKEIPHYPSKIAVLSGYPSAALADILRTIKNRYPVARVIVFPIPVQGKGAYTKIIEQLKYVDTLNFSTIIIGRGGGSLEELWNFNEEALARCIYDLKTPIISGVGHEIDFTLCDFSSDYRALTPTAAAIKATPDITQMAIDINVMYDKLVNYIKNRVDREKSSLDKLQNSYLFMNPERIYLDYATKLDHVTDNLYTNMNIKIYNIKSNNENITNKFKNKINLFTSLEENKVLNFQTIMKQLIKQKYNNNIENYYFLMSKLNTLSPLKTLERGYAVVSKDKKIISSKYDVEHKDEIVIKFNDGSIKAIVK